MIHSRVYFEDLYRHNSDPWGYDFHWYEARKRQICLALLTKPRYLKVLEVGCSNGHLSFHLAQRADELL
ncbi:MAG: class I SAM-dependent methyltransferase, partial [Acinetobacter sp.]